MGVSVRTVERRLESLEDRGFLERLPIEKPKGKLARRPINLANLISVLEGLARANLEMRQAFQDDLEA